MPTWSPAAWNDFGVVGIVLFVTAALIVALLRGWLVFGWVHKEIVAMHVNGKAERDARIEAQAKTIDLVMGTNRAQAQALSKRAADDDLSAKLMASIRELAADR